MAKAYRNSKVAAAMDSDWVIFLVWGSGLLFFVVIPSARACYRNCIREDGGGPPPANEAAAVHRRILLRLDKVTYPRQNSLPASTTSGLGGGGRPSTTTAAGTAAAAAEEEDCAICLGQFEDGDRCSVMPICHHEFHRDCIANWLLAQHNTCPLCRAKLQWSLAAQDMV